MHAGKTKTKSCFLAGLQQPANCEIHQHWSGHRSGQQHLKWIRHCTYSLVHLDESLVQIFLELTPEQNEGSLNIFLEQCPEGSLSMFSGARSIYANLILLFQVFLDNTDVRLLPVSSYSQWFHISFKTIVVSE